MFSSEPTVSYEHSASRQETGYLQAALASNTVERHLGSTLNKQFPPNECV